MTRRNLIAVLATTPAVRAQNKATRPKYEVQLLRVSAHVEDSRINIDGRVRNSAAKPIENLRVIFEILDPSGQVLTKQQGPIEESLLDVGEEGSFHVQLAWHARTHAFRIGFEDGSGRELRADKPGPFPID